MANQTADYLLEQWYQDLALTLAARHFCKKSFMAFEGREDVSNGKLPNNTCFPLSLKRRPSHYGWQYPLASSKTNCTVV